MLGAVRGALALGRKACAALNDPDSLNNAVCLMFGTVQDVLMELGRLECLPKHDLRQSDQTKRTARIIRAYWTKRRCGQLNAQITANTRWGKYLLELVPFYRIYSPVCPDMQRVIAEAESAVLKTAGIIVTQAEDAEEIFRLLHAMLDITMSMLYCLRDDLHAPRTYLLWCMETCGRADPERARHADEALRGIVAPLAEQIGTECGTHADLADCADLMLRRDLRLDTDGETDLLLKTLQELADLYYSPPLTYVEWLRQDALCTAVEQEAEKIGALCGEADLEYEGSYADIMLRAITGQTE